MINWSDITLEDKPRIEEKICASGCHGADYGFANLFIWRKAYRPKIAFCDDRLLVGMPLFAEAGFLWECRSGMYTHIRRGPER